MRTITFLPHTADVRIKLEADTLNELFLGGVEAINSILKPDFCALEEGMKIWHTIEVRSADITLLLVDFLSEVLTLSHMEKVIFCGVVLEVIDEGIVKATLKGKPVDGFSEDIKAVTYHEADVKQNKLKKWESVLIVDI